MYQVLLADDEEIIREGIRRAVPWESLSLSLAAEAGDGKEALACAAACHPEIVITDIRMPCIDGLELIRILHKCNPNCRIVILTGHEEFEYARTAIQLGVSEYLLKPVDISELCSVLVKLVQELDVLHGHNRELERLHLQAQADDMWQRQRTLQRFLAGKIDTDQLLRHIPNEWKEAKYCAGVLIQIDNFDWLIRNKNEEAIFRFTSELEEILISQSEKNMCVVEKENGRYFVLILGDQTENLSFHVRSFVRRLRAGTIQVSYTTISSLIVAGGIQNSKIVYEEVFKCVDRVFLMGDGHDIQTEEVETPPFMTSLPREFDMKAIVHALAGFNKTEIRKTLTQTAQSIRQNMHNSYLYTSMIVGFVYGEMISILEEMHCPVQSVLPEPMREYSHLMAGQSLDSMMEDLMRIVEQVCDFVEKNVRGRQDAVDRAKIFIREHYSNAKLSLDLVASAVGISPTYLSALFKQELEQSFVGYLTETRIDHAKQLLRDSQYRSYEISYMCGYENSTYFSTIFKRHVGCTPSEYRKQMARTAHDA